MNPPNRSSLHENHCFFKSLLGRFDEAVAKFEQALKIKAEFEPAKAGLARVAQSRKAPPLVPNSPVPLP